MNFMSRIFLNTLYAIQIITASTNRKRIVGNNIIIPNIIKIAITTGADIAIIPDSENSNSDPNTSNNNVVVIF